MKKKKSPLKKHMINSNPKRYKTKLHHELIRFFEDKQRSIPDFCVEMNKWMINHGYEPIRGTPFKAKDGKLYELSTQNQRIKVLKQYV
mgnify:FL=1